MATNNVNPNDERLLEAKEQGNDVMKEYETGMQKAIDSNNNAMNDALDEIGEMGKNGKWTKGSATAALVDAQNAQTDFAIEEIKQQKEQAHKDYTKEQSGAYTDWQKQSNAYGANAEQLASQGLLRSGYSESSKVAMYNQYQTRVTAAREAMVRADQEFANNMNQARLQNNSTLAQIYLDAYKQRLEVITQYTFQGNQLLTQLAQQKAAIKQQNQANYQSVYNQIVQEMQIKKQQELDERQVELEEDKFAWQKAQAASAVRTATRKGTTKTTSGGGTVNKGKATGTNKEINKLKDNAGSGNKGSSVSVDMNSVLALGYGPISAGKLNSLVASGVVKEYEQDGKLKYKKVVGKGAGWAGGRNTSGGSAGGR